jgi:ribonuclease HI
MLVLMPMYYYDASCSGNGGGGGEGGVARMTNMKRLNSTSVGIVPSIGETSHRGV